MSSDSKIVKNNTGVSINFSSDYYSEKLSGGTYTPSTRNLEIDEAIKRSEGMKSIEVFNKQYSEIKSNAEKFNKIIKLLKSK